MQARLEPGTYTNSSQLPAPSPDMQVPRNKTAKPGPRNGPVTAQKPHLKPSTDANHWEVARKMVGFLVRQSYGYLCSYSSSLSSTPACDESVRGAVRKRLMCDV